MTEGWKRSLVKAAGFGAGFAVMSVTIVAGGMWYFSRPKPVAPWNRTAIEAEFIGPAASEEKDVINLWYSINNSTPDDYKINQNSDVTTAGWTTSDDALYGFNQGISFDPIIIPAHRKAKIILHVPLATREGATGGGTISPQSAEAFLSINESEYPAMLTKLSSESRFALLEALRQRAKKRADGEVTYERFVSIFLHSEFVGLRGFVVMDDTNRYEIDFPLISSGIEETKPRAM